MATGETAEPTRKGEPGRCVAAARRFNDYRRREETMTREEIAARAQRMLWGAIATLQEVEDTLDCLSGLMPESSPDMLEYRVPYDVMLEVEGDIRCSLNDDLRPMIARLKRAAVVTAAELDQHWLERQRERTN